MRVTNSMLASTFLTDMNRNLNNLQTLQQQMTSGKEDRLPSDDPFKVARSMQLHTDINTNKQYNKNIEDTINFLDITDMALNQSTNMMQRVNELLVSAGNAAYASSERLAIKDEINQKIAELSQILNTSFDGKYIFSGSNGTTKPIRTTGGVNYSNTTSIKIDTNEEQIKNWKNVKLTIENPSDPNKNFDLDMATLTNKANLDDLAFKINTEINKSGVIKDGSFKVVTNNKDGCLLFVNETGEELSVKLSKNDSSLATAVLPSDIVGKIIITESKKNDNGNIKLEYNTDDGKANENLSENLMVEISQGVIINYNVTAVDVLNFQDKDGNNKNLIEVLQSITNHLDGNNSEGNATDSEAIIKLLTDDIVSLKGAMENILRVRAEVGSKENRMDSARDRNIEQNFNLTEILSKTEDIDITEKTMQYAVLQSVYLASLQTSAKILQPTLMDYIR